MWVVLFPLLFFYCINISHNYILHSLVLLKASQQKLVMDTMGDSQLYRARINHKDISPPLCKLSIIVRVSVT